MSRILFNTINARKCGVNASVPKQAQWIPCTVRISRQRSCDQSVGKNESFRQYLWGSKGIRQWLINWLTSQMVIHKIIPSEDWN